jgi:hypothetical protein
MLSKSKSKIFYFGFYLTAFLVCLILFNGKLNQHIHLQDAKSLASSSISDSLVSEQKKMLEFMLVRDVTNDIEDRKKYRWLYKKVEVKFYSLVEKLNINFLKEKHIVLLHYSLIIFFTFLFSMESIRVLFSTLDKKTLFFSGLFFFLMYSTVLLITSLDEWFTYVEAFAISLAIYASLKKNMLLFAISVLIGVSVRESSLLLGVIYPLVNYRLIGTLKSVFLAVMPFVIFFIINNDIIDKFFDLVLHVSTGEERPSLLNPNSLLMLQAGEILFSSLVYTVFLLPLVVLVFHKRVLKSYNWLFNLIIIRLFVIFFGSYYGNYTLLMLLIPTYVLLAAIIFKYE